MDCLSAMAAGGHDRVLAVHDGATGLRAWIVLHHVRRGPAYGGIRVWSYRDEADAFYDALRLSRAMTFKCVLAGVPGGGAKTVVLADHLISREGAMEELGRHVEALGGAYEAGPDVGFTAADQRALARTTSRIACFEDAQAGTRSAGEATADGALHGIRAALQHLGMEGLDGVHVAVQGLGSVGGALARRLISAGARVSGSDLHPAACEAAGADGVELVDASRIHEVECDVFVPCALGGTIHDLTISKLRTRVVAGVANNVLGSPHQAETLRRRGILFVPDFVLNAGALIEGSGFRRTGRADWSREIAGIGDTVREVLERAAREDVDPVEAAERIAEERVAAVARDEDAVAAAR